MANNRAINREYVEKRHADNGNASHLCRVAGKRLVNIQVKKQGGNQYNRLLICRGNVRVYGVSGTCVDVLVTTSSWEVGDCNSTS